MAPEIIIAELAEPSDARAAVPFGVPRRFGVGTILIVTAAFAGLLGLLRWLGAPPLAVGFLVGFVSLVGLGQAVLFHGRRPRRLNSTLTCLPPRRGMLGAWPSPCQAR